MTKSHTRTVTHSRFRPCNVAEELQRCSRLRRMMSVAGVHPVRFLISQLLIIIIIMMTVVACLQPWSASMSQRRKAELVVYKQITGESW